MKKKFGFLSKGKEKDAMVLERAETGVSSSGSVSDIHGTYGSPSSETDSQTILDPSLDEEDDVLYGVVLWAFEGGNEGELGVKEGTRVVILGDAEEWMFCEFEDARGYVPRAYIEPIEPTPKSAHGSGGGGGPLFMRNRATTGRRSRLRF